MKRIILLRHAKSSWDDARLADFERPLNARGLRVAPAMGKYLSEHAVQANVILASTALRVRQTLDSLLPQWNCSAEVLWEKSLYLASLHTLENFVLGLHDSWSSAMLVGHNPGLSELASHLAGRDIQLSTCAVAIFESNAESWSKVLSTRPLRCTGLWKPKEVLELE